MEKMDAFRRPIVTVVIRVHQKGNHTEEAQSDGCASSISSLLLKEKQPLQA